MSYKDDLLDDQTGWGLMQQIINNQDDQVLRTNILKMFASHLGCAGADLSHYASATCDRLETIIEKTGEAIK